MTDKVTSPNPFFANVPVPDYDQLVNCLHCGLCLPTCPTYEMTGLERHSPRGRIRMIKAVADGDLDISPTFIDSMDFCLDCQACVTACPAGVQYGQLVESARHQIFKIQEVQGKTSVLKRWILSWLFSKNKRLRMLAVGLGIYQKSGLKWMVEKTGILAVSKVLNNIHGMQPKAGKLIRYPERTVAREKNKKSTVGVITGCIQDLFFGDVNLDTIDVLKQNGCDVVVPPNQECCGSVNGHSGDIETARALAKHMIDVFDKAGVDYIIINSAGCGSFLKHYDQFFFDDPKYLKKAEDFSKRVKDISEFLNDFGFEIPKKSIKMNVTYHEPCHLVHGQQISKQPRAVIQSLPGLEYTELEESSWCCGSAGIYNITHYKDSMILLERKMENIRKTKANIVVTGNPGCLIQLFYGRDKFNVPIKVMHPVSLLNLYYKNDLGKSNGGIHA